MRVHPPEPGAPSEEAGAPPPPAPSRPRTGGPEAPAPRDAPTEPRGDLLDLFVPPALAAADPARYLAARRVALATLILLGANTFFLILTQLRELTPLHVLGLAGGVLTGGALLALLRLTGRDRLVGVLLVAGYLGVLVFQALIDLGLDNPSLVGGLLIPVIAALTLPRGYVLALAAGTAAVYVALYVAHLAGWEPAFRATTADIRIYLVVLYGAGTAALAWFAHAYARLRDGQDALRVALGRERAARADEERRRREAFDAAVAEAAADARRDARRYRDRLRSVLYRTRIEASRLLETHGDGVAPATDGAPAVRLLRLANAHEALLGLEDRPPRPEPVRPGALLRRVAADVAATVAPPATVQFWVQREDAAAPATTDPTAPEAPVVVDRALLYWALRLVLEHAADAAPHGHVTVTLHRAAPGPPATGEAAPPVALSVHCFGCGPVEGPAGGPPALQDPDPFGALPPDAAARDVRLPLARALLERGGGRLDVRPRGAFAAPAGAPDAGEHEEPHAAPDELLVVLALPQAR